MAIGYTYSYTGAFMNNTLITLLFACAFAICTVSLNDLLIVHHLPTASEYTLTVSVDGPSITDVTSTTPSICSLKPDIRAKPIEWESDIGPSTEQLRELMIHQLCAEPPLQS